MKRLSFIFISCVITWSMWAVEVHIADPKTWTSQDLASYVNQTVTFDAPMFLLHKNSVKLSPYCQDDKNYVVLNGTYPRSTRDRTFSRDLEAKVKWSNNGNYYLEYVSGSFDGNTRETLRDRGLDSLQINAKGEARLLVCAANLEYYLVKNLGTGYGPDNQQQHNVQRQKTRKALAKINADIYGFCEIEQGTAALLEICNDLNAAHPNRNFSFVNNSTSSAAGSYTMTAFIYDVNKVHPAGSIYESQIGVKNRKYMQYFIENSTNEGFIFSINHFKAKVGGGDTEATRIAEANSVNELYNKYRYYCHEDDILIMGDLNAYANEEPITILLQDGSRTDLHQYCHPEGSYSYLYGSAIGYLDHAIVNSTLLPQVTGMQAFHVNSDETDAIAYQSGDTTMFRYSDHDPIVVGLNLSKNASTELKVLNFGENLCVQNGEGGYVRIYDMNGYLLYQCVIESNNCTIFSSEEIPCMRQGCYIVHVYHNGVNHVTKFLRP